MLGNVLFYMDISSSHPTEDKDEFWMATLVVGAEVVVVGRYSTWWAVV